jgi:hypothetical protein
MVVDKTSLLISFDKTLSVVIQKSWEFISNPAIFIATIILILVWNFRDSINQVFKKIKEIKYKDFSASIGPDEDFYSSKPSQPNPTIDIKKGEAEQEDRYRSIISVLGEKTASALLEIDNKILSVDDVIDILKEKKIFYNDSVPAKLSDVYYYGIFKGFYSYLARALFIVEPSKDRSQAKFTSQPKVKELIEKRIEELDKSKTK